MNNKKYIEGCLNNYEHPSIYLHLIYNLLSSAASCCVNKLIFAS